jgi:hypothetical protein
MCHTGKVNTLFHYYYSEKIAFTGKYWLLTLLKDRNMIFNPPQLMREGESKTFVYNQPGQCDYVLTFGIS